MYAGVASLSCGVRLGVYYLLLVLTHLGRTLHWLLRKRPTKGIGNRDKANFVGRRDSLILSQKDSAAYSCNKELY